MCKVLGVSFSSFYDWFERPPSQRERHNVQLLQAIKDSHETSDRTYGSPRVVLDLLDAAWHDSFFKLVVCKLQFRHHGARWGGGANPIASGPGRVKTQNLQALFSRAR